jgi:glycine/D-amino acid oxidase-like deaminating enzyme
MINKLILKYLSCFARFANEEIAASWNGIYPKMTNGETEFITSPADGITVVNGLGGSGMTLSFGLAEQLLNGTYQHQ